MNPIAIALVLTAAVLHASWNLLNKRAGDGGRTFVFLAATVSSLVFTPIVAVYFVIERPHIGWMQFLFLLGTGVWHIGYALCLQRGYATGDMSIVYPVARGTGPLLAVAGAIILLGERPPLVALCGAVAVAGGVFALARQSRKNEAHLSTKAVSNGVLTGVFIAGYTLWDQSAVTTYAIAPILLAWSGDTIRLLFLAPQVRREPVVDIWTRYKREIIGVGIMSDCAYLLILWAYHYAPVSRVAPMREVSILVGVGLASWFLKEEDLKKRLPAAAVIVAGVVLLTTA